MEAVLEGKRELVESVLAWCERGPHGAVVEGVDVTWEEPIGEQGFEVR